MEKKCSHTPLTEKAAGDLLSQHGINRTKTKLKILQIISRSERPLAVQEIHSRMKESCDVSTIFRTISQFKEKKIINEINLDEGFSRFELQGHDHHHHHHHHVRCRNCGEIKNLEHCDLSAFERAIQKLGFTEMEHRLEFSGLCSKCS